jgi:hypothetical protein
VNLKGALVKLLEPSLIFASMTSGALFRHSMLRHAPTLLATLFLGIDSSQPKDDRSLLR